MEIENVIDYILEIYKDELPKKIEIWEDQKYKFKNNEEYFLNLKRIELANAIIEHFKYK